MQANCHMNIDRAIEGRFFKQSSAFIMYTDTQPGAPLLGIVKPPRLLTVCTHYSSSKDNIVTKVFDHVHYKNRSANTLQTVVSL